MFGLSRLGFKRKRYNDVLESMEKNARDLFGENVNLTERSPLGLFFKVIAYPVSKLWELAESVYYSAFIDFTEGVGVDRVAKNIAVSRHTSSFATGEITLYGIYGVKVPSGFRIATQDDRAFETIEEVTIQENGEATSRIISLLPGLQYNVPSEAITEIINPISGVDSVLNKKRTENGSDTETDEEFRNRYDRSLATGGSATRESIEAALLKLPDVTDAIVEGNDTMQEVNGIPPKSIAAYIHGGDDADVAETILNSKAFGIQAFGSTQRTVKDSKGNLHVIGFSRPTIVPIHIKINLITSNFFNPKDKETIKSAIIDYIGGVDKDGNNHKGLGVGQSVIHTKIIGLCHVASGVRDVTVEISSDGLTWIQRNFDIGALEVPETDDEKVIIN